MFLGHYAVALAAKKAAPQTSLGTLFLATQFIDLLWPVLLLLGLEHVQPDLGNTAFTPYDFYDYPISHSLLAVLGWSLAFAAVYHAVRRYQRGAWILGLGVLSHWVLDAVSHRPDLPLVPGTADRVGLGLWHSVAGTIVVESALFLAGLWLYLRATQARDRVGRYALWALIGFSVFIYVGNVLSRQQPVSAEVMAYGALSQWLFIPWAYWIDRHRQPASAPAQQNA